MTSFGQQTERQPFNMIYDSGPFINVVDTNASNEGKDKSLLYDSVRDKTGEDITEKWAYDSINSTNQLRPQRNSIAQVVGGSSAEFDVHEAQLAASYFKRRFPSNAEGTTGSMRHL